MACPSREYISPKKAGRFVGLEDQSVRKAIKAKKFPGEVIYLLGKPLYRIATQKLLKWFDDEIERFELHIADLKRRKRRFEEFLYGVTK